MSVPVLVTGLGVVCSIGHDVASFTAALRAGRSGIREEPDESAPRGVRLVAPVRDFDLAVALECCAGLAPATRRRARRAAHRSPEAVQIALAAAAQAWQDAELDARPVPGDRIALIVGGHNLTGRYAFDHHPTYAREPAHLPARYPLHIQDTDHVGTLSQGFGITGEGYTVGASSASGNAAVIHAARLIECGAASVSLAVGALARLSPPDAYALAKLGVLARAPAAPGPACRPFDRDCAGFVPGEAAACLVLESASSAARRRGTALAELAGYGAGLDGSNLSTPNVEGESRVMTRALARAGIRASEVDYVNAHATATPAGDEAELAALRDVFGDAVGAPWLNATKALVGHCLSAAGTVEAVATVIQMRDGFVHPNPSLTRPTAAGYRFAPWYAVPTRLERAISNSFGFGGFNSCVVLRRG